MAILCGLVFMTGSYPLWRAWQANWGTSLVYALGWATASWVVWLMAVVTAIWWPWSDTTLPRYLALCLTGCASVAVLGARRPGVGPWNFVLVGLLAILLLPLAYGMGKLKPEWANILFLAGTIAIGVLNYVPTRLAPAALVLAIGCGIEIAGWSDPQRWGAESVLSLGPILIGLSLWAAFLQQLGRSQPPTEFDRLWLRFRDRFGLVWSQRVREQFNRSVANAGWPVHLRWTGLRRTPGTEMPPAEVQQEIVETLRALLKRFEEEPAEPPTVQ